MARRWKARYPKLVNGTTPLCPVSFASVSFTMFSRSYRMVHLCARCSVQACPESQTTVNDTGGVRADTPCQRTSLPQFTFIPGDLLSQKPQADFLLDSLWQAWERCSCLNQVLEKGIGAHNSLDQGLGQSCFMKFYK